MIRTEKAPSPVWFIPWNPAAPWTVPASALSFSCPAAACAAATATIRIPPTFGGDPLFQPDFTGAVLKGCRELGLHTCLDTSGHLGVNAGEEMLADTDLVLLDIKAWNPERYRSLTGGELRPTLEFAERLASLRKPVWLRYVLVPGVTDNLEEIEGLSRHAALLGNVERVDVLPFHQMGRFKWDELKLDYTLKGTPEASAKLAEQVRGIFRREGFPDCVH